MTLMTLLWGACVIGSCAAFQGLGNQEDPILDSISNIMFGLFVGTGIFFFVALPALGKLFGLA